ncbi:MAG TPA: DNA internalization-related competence protein ComEC/Rec2 [Clostridiaceae bacterium]|nr:DNA internalization-related competence protein ComEC/Rec2 [Clostridiaceae bacterium]
MINIKRLFCVASISYIIGIIMRLYFGSIAFLSIPIAIIILLITKNKKIIVILICLIISIGYVSILENKYSKISDMPIKEMVTITSDIQEKEYKKVCTAKIVRNNKKILINIKMSQDIPSMKYGDSLYIEGEFKQPEEARNYKGYNYKQYLKTKKIIGTVELEKVKILKSSNGSFIHNIQKYIRDTINGTLTDEEGNLLLAILLGDKDKLSEDIQESFKTSNLSHMLAVSGAHVSYIILGLTYVLQNSIIGKKNGKIVCIIFLLAFMAITNFTPSVTRACIMAILTLFSSIIYRKSDVYTNISVAALITLIFNPYSLLDLGFQLSYGGTIGIIIFIKRIQEKKSNSKVINYIKQMALVSIYANIIIIPIMMYHFNTVSFTFIISNIMASPILGIIVITGFLFIIASITVKPLTRLIAIFIKPILSILIKISQICSKLPFSNILVVTPYMFNVISYYAIILYCIKSKKNNKCKIIICLLIVLILTNFIIYIFPQKLRIFFIDVGQGDSTLIITPDKKTVLIDGGGSDSFDVGEKVLLPYLLDRRILKIDYVLISHFDTDHCGGILTIMEKVKVKNIIISEQAEHSENYERFKKLMIHKKIRLIEVKKGDKIKIGRYSEFKILFPTSRLLSENPLNNNSIVAQFNYNNFKMLFTGDIEKLAEQQILKTEKAEIRADILKVAHHGSKTSSIPEFIKAVRPKIALIGVGKNNTFGHPNQQTIKNLENIKCRIYRTDLQGEIIIKIDQKGRMNVKSKLKIK